MTNLETFASLFPLAIYLGFLGMRFYFKRPVIWNGALDFALLGFGMTGFVIVGPVKLLCPGNVFAFWQGWTFFLLVALYWLCVFMISGSFGLKTVIYNVDMEQFFGVLYRLRATEELEPQGNVIMIPKMKIQFTISFFPHAKVVILRATSEQNLAGWIQWERILRETLQKTVSPFNVWSVILSATSVVLFTICFFIQR